MEILYRCCCGMDVHKKFVVACLLRIDEQGEETRHMQRFETYTEDLLRLSDWLTSSGCTHVAMESTGVYWKPIYNLLEGHLELLVVNAHHIKAVPGRKTDVKDAEWIAELLQHGLLKASFIPPRSQRDWRDLTRYRTSLVQERVRIVNRLQKVLEDANLKLAGVATDVMGKSGRVMLEAILAGATDPEQLAELAKGRLRNKLPQLKQALNGRVRAHHRFLLVEQLSRLFGRSDRAAQWRDCRAVAPFPGRDPAVRHDSRNQPLDRRSVAGRDRPGHEPISRRPSSGFLGGHVSGAQRKRRQAPERQNPQGEPVAAAGVD
jgi:transposase